MGDDLSHWSAGLRNWLTTSAFIWGFKVVLWTGIKHTLTFLRFSYVFSLCLHLKHVRGGSAARGACCHRFSPLAGCLQPAEIPFPRWRQGTEHHWEHHPASISWAPAPTSQFGAGAPTCPRGATGPERLLQRPLLLSPLESSCVLPLMSSEDC